MEKMELTLLQFKKKIREMLANYIQSEGCGCCSDSIKHSADLETLGRLLNVKKYSDGSGYDFSKYKSKTQK